MPPPEATAGPDGFRIAYRDSDLVVVVKTSGELAVPGRTADPQDCLFARVRRLHADALVVHRLDMATSGLMIFARGLAAQRTLGNAFAQRRVEKRYVAVVAGWVAADEGVVDLPLAPDWPNRPRQQVAPSGGKASLTLYRVLSRDAAADTSRVELQPRTGRSHQLRVHLQALGHPILGDALYAADAVRARAPRLLLHASGLGFDHPRTEARIELTDAPPF